MSGKEVSDEHRLDRMRRSLEQATLAHAAMTLDDSPGTMRDAAVTKYVRAMDLIFDDLAALQKSGALDIFHAVLRAEVS